MPAAAFCFAGQARSLHIEPVWRSAQKHVFAVARHHRQTADLFAVLDANYTETLAVLQFLRFVNVAFLPLRKGSSQYERFARCHELIVHHERAARDGSQYDWVVRLRPDLLWYGDLDLALLSTAGVHSRQRCVGGVEGALGLESISTGEVAALSRGCAAGGDVCACDLPSCAPGAIRVDDQVAAIPRKFAAAYLVDAAKPCDAAALAEFDDTCKPERCPAVCLTHNLLRLEVPLIRTSHFRFTIARAQTSKEHAGSGPLQLVRPPPSGNEEGFVTLPPLAERAACHRNSSAKHRRHTAHSTAHQKSR